MNGGEPGHGSQIAGTKPRGRFLALELAQASFKSLKVVVTHDLVTARGGWLLRIVTARASAGVLALVRKAIQPVP